MAGIQEGVGGHAEDPLGQAEFGFQRQQRLDFAVALAVEVPPAGAVGHEMQFAGGRPLGLEDRFRLFAGYEPGCDECAVGGDVRDP